MMERIDNTAIQLPIKAINASSEDRSMDMVKLIQLYQENIFNTHIEKMNEPPNLKQFLSSSVSDLYNQR
jgi:hypothetical protein